MTWEERAETHLCKLFYGGMLLTGAFYLVDLGPPGLATRQGVATSLLYVWGVWLLLGGGMGLAGSMFRRLRLEVWSLRMLALSFMFLSLSAALAQVDFRYALAYSSMAMLLMAYAFRRASPTAAQYVTQWVQEERDSHQDKEL